MSIVEFVDISLQRQPKGVLTGFTIDSPQIGMQQRMEAVDFNGWIIGGNTEVKAIDVVAGPRQWWRAEMGVWRADIALAYPAVGGAERSGFAVRLDLSTVPPVFELTLFAVLTDGRRLTLGRLRGRRLVTRSVTGPTPEGPSPTIATLAPTPLPQPAAAVPGPRAAVVIPVHNQHELTQQCLQTLFTSGGAAVPFEVIVVDDGSSDETPEIVAQFDTRVRILRLDPNAGFASACNAGAAVATADYVIFLNNDTIPQPGWLDALVDHADAHPQAAIVGAKLLYPDGTVQHAGVSFILEGFPHHIYTGFPADHPAVNQPRRFKAVTAACCLVRKDLFRSMGGFDRAFVNGWEDVDLCLRLVDAGHQIHYCPTSVVVHLESATRDESSPREVENRRRWAQRWIGRVRSDCLDYWAADRLLTIDLLGARYPLRINVAPELAVRVRQTRVARPHAHRANLANDALDRRQRRRFRRSTPVTNARERSMSQSATVA